jgi:hypothetical protein
MREGVSSVGAFSFEGDVSATSSVLPCSAVVSLQLRYPTFDVPMP